MKHWNVIGYTYDADIHTIRETQRRFPRKADGLHDEHGIPIPSLDSEGNSIHPIYHGEATEADRYALDYLSEREPLREATR